MAETYSRILADADAFFRRVMESQPEQLQCGRGCSLCCYGLFEIGSGDVPMLAEGLAKLHPARRMKIVRKSREIVASSAHPDLRECSPIEKDAAAWDLQWEDELGPEDVFTIPEAIVLIARMRGW